ncbi:HlyD family efflux transporter periplasmic adaptor subunit [Schnuerera sp.]|uniref:HlyD family efflux transporter periplasmic adaptor subunit n=1 Tax=Schnuerera sp. TaxID=2794844 RepID=UPI002C191A95|nr:HlyD family efflux transporter periplasmic adaptor subunit [Schnuerera sp.]HSH36243.1 HlyD family efflux transporter periplasmic adaptor subunit [Schnuerera sp.]
MSQEERKRKRKIKKRWRFFWISLIFIFLFFRSVPSLFATAFKTVLPDKYIIEDKIETEAIIIRRESLYKADGEGTIEIYVDHGDRVAVGTKVAKITLLDDTSTLKQELEEIENKIEVLTKTKLDSEGIKKDEEKLKENIGNIIGDIQTSINQNDYERAEILKDKLSMYDGKQKDIGRDDTLISQSLENLNEKRDKVKKQIISNTENYFSKESGIVSFKIDGYEEIYSISHKDDYKYSDFKEIVNNQRIVSNNDTIKTDEPVFKIIDNFQWYMIVKIENMKDISSYEEGDPILLTGEEVEGELKGYIERISDEKDKGLIVVRFNTDFHNYFDKRGLDINIIKFKYDGYRIPKKAILEKDEINGVYIKEISGIIRFRPIEILDEDDEFAYISKGDNNYNINIKGSDTPVRTVREFDEILLNTISIKEGMIIN